MGYVELKGTNQEIAQSILKQVLDHEDTVTMIVMGLDQEEIARMAKEAANQEPNTWWVVWVQNPNLLTEEQINKYKDKDIKTVACTLSRTDKLVRRLGIENAQYKDQLLAAFLEAQDAD